MGLYCRGDRRERSTYLRCVGDTDHRLSVDKALAGGFVSEEGVDSRLHEQAGDQAKEKQGQYLRQRGGRGVDSVSSKGVDCRVHEQPAIKQKRKRGST